MLKGRYGANAQMTLVFAEQPAIRNAIRSAATGNPNEAATDFRLQRMLLQIHFRHPLQ
jgi:hypothetical protein